MHLKTYRASDLAAALKKARAEMGPQALVLGTTEKRGRFGLTAVEVTVGIARENGTTGPAGDPSLPQLARAIGEEHRKIERDPPARRRPRLRRRAAPAPREASIRKRGLRVAVRSLLAAGLSRDLALRFARAAFDGLPAAADAQALAEAMERGSRDLLSFAPPLVGKRCAFVVGPPGCGKTTTVAKLVARASTPDGGPAVFAQTDHDRIGSLAQAELFSRYIGARVARVEDASDLRSVLRHAGEGGRVVVDTPGIGAGDRERLRELVELRRQVPRAVVALLIPAGVHRREASRILDRFAPLEPTCVGFSRIDDGTLPGELVNALAGRRIPLSFFTNGPSVPDDLTWASPRGLASVLLRAGSAAAPNPEVPQR